jgi:hypothetical protein
VVARGPGDVGCAHCTKIGATQTCQVCTHLVCDACAADWTTCSEPAGREVRLGTTARVKDVDPNGRFAIVSHWVKAPRLFDLRQLRWNELPMSRSEIALMHNFPPRVTSTGLLAHANIRWVDNETTIWGVRWRSLAGSVDEVIDAEGMQRCTMMSTSDQLAYVSMSEKVVVMTPELGELPHATSVLLPRAFAGPTFSVATRVYDPMPRKVIHAMHLTNDILVTSTWRELAIDRIVDDKLERLVRLDTARDANIHWVALAGNVLAYVTQGVVEVRRVDAAYNVGEVFARHRGDFNSAALSVDGRYLALGMGDRVILHDLEHDVLTTYEEHSDKVSFVKFAADDHMLITADDDNRVVLRPRTEAGYARAIIPA